MVPAAGGGGGNHERPPQLPCDLEAFGRLHREALNHPLGLNFKRWHLMPPPSISTAPRKPDGENKAHIQDSARFSRPV